MRLSLLTTLILGLAARGQALDPVTPPPLISVPWTRPGDPVPEGYRVRSEPTWALFGAGLLLLAVSYIPVTVLGVQSGHPLNAVPIIGPMLTYHPPKDPWLGGLLDAGSQMAMGANMVFQLGGVVMLMMGLAVRKGSLEPVPTTPGLQLVPTAPGSTVGASVVARF